jgi:hypothetical protein
MGEVVEVGKANKKLKVGDRVVVPFTIICGECEQCRRGNFSVCERTNRNKHLADKAFGHTTAGLFGYTHLTGGYPGGQAGAGALCGCRSDQGSQKPFGRAGSFSGRYFPNGLAGCVALGVLEIVAPQRLSRTLGLQGGETLIASSGLREVATGVAILTSRNPAPFVWGRVVGDALDLVSLLSGFGGSRRKLFVG